MVCFLFGFPSEPSKKKGIQKGDTFTSKSLGSPSIAGGGASPGGAAGPDQCDTLRGSLRDGNWAEGKTTPQKTSLRDSPSNQRPERLWLIWGLFGGPGVGGASCPPTICEVVPY